MNKRDKGILYLCGTPIGNLEDITLRVLRILKEVDYIAAEDTRHTLKLLNHFEISKPLISYHEHNKREKGPEIIAMIEKGHKIALVSDAGMPGISDPGADLVTLGHEAGIHVTILPGPSAALAALVLSGLSTERFAFEGFLPRDKKMLKLTMAKLKEEDRTIILYEAPHRIKSTLKELLAELGNRRLSIARELTKVYEEVLQFTLEEAIKYYGEENPRGEFVLIIEGAPQIDNDNKFLNISIEDHLIEYLQAGMKKKDAIKQVAKDRNIPKNEVYPYSIGLKE